MFYKTVRRFLNPDGSQGGAPSGEQTDQQSQQNVAPQIDYGKIQQMLDGTLAACLALPNCKELLLHPQEKVPKGVYFGKAGYQRF